MIEKRLAHKTLRIDSDSHENGVLERRPEGPDYGRILRKKKMAEADVFSLGH
jgi:hypothetical protein